MKDLRIRGVRFVGSSGRAALWSTATAAILAVLLAAGPVAAQQGAGGGTAPQGSRIVDRTLGEEEQIRMREEWFLSSRSDGTTTSAERAALRLEAVRQTRVAIERQQRLRADGAERLQNFWIPKGPSPSTFGGWTFGNVAGRISSIAADWTGGVLYLGTASGGVWKSVNDGLSWTQLFDSAGTMTIGTVAVDPNDPNVIWVGTGENGRSCESYFGIGLLRSADGGLTWETRNGSGGNTLDELASFANVIVDPRDSDHIVTGGRLRQCTDGSGFSGGLYSTSNGGLTWNNRLSGTRVYEIAQDPSVLDVFWAATDTGIYKSTDNGVSWNLQTAGGLPSGSVGRAELAVAPSASNTVYALFSNGPSLWRTVDGGANWNLVASGGSACDGQCSYNMVLRVHRTNPETVYRGTVHVFKSTNGGSNWSDLSNNWGSSQKVHQDTHHLLMHPTQTDTFYVGSDGGIWKSTNGGSSFSNLNGNLNITQFYAVGVAADDPDLICGGAQDNSSLVRTTSDQWDLQAVTGDGFVCHFNPQNSDYAYITSYPSGGYPNVWRSTSGPFGGFVDITGAGRGIVNGDRTNWVTPYILDPVTPNILYLGTQRVYRSDDFGDSWSQVGPNDMTGGSGSLVALDVNRNFPDNVLASSTSGRVWRTADGGGNWTNITSGLPSRSVNDVAADPTDPDRAFAVVGGFNTDHVWEWTSAGGWTPRSTGLPNVPTNTVLMLTDTDLLVGTDTGIFRSFDGGQTFQPFMNGLPEGLVVTDLRYNSQQNLVTAGTYGRGAWQISIDPVNPILLFDSVELPLVNIDSDGDGNVEPGETWAARAVLRNGGGAEALGVQARLSTSTPGVTLPDGGWLTFGDIIPGAAVPALDTADFILDPTITCGATVVFDLVDITSTNDPIDHDDQTAAFSVSVGENFDPPIVTTQLDENFEDDPSAAWSHEAVVAGLPPCGASPNFDEWKLASKDAAHGTSYHCGNGPGSTYNKRDFSWLYHGGKDSEGGAGIQVPADAIAATLTVEHWYSTLAGVDGGQVVIDASDDGLDIYSPLVPENGYPGSPLATGGCNGLEGMNAFNGSSGGWTTSTFDMLAYKGQTVYLAFVFGSSVQSTGGEGWYIDDIKVESLLQGDVTCTVLEWPGSVPASSRFELNGLGTIDASWSETCNAAVLPGQGYSIQVGDLDLLRSSGTYSHAPLDGRCDQVSPVAFAPGAGNEYYVVVPNDAVHDGGAGTDSSGVSRAAASSVCGERREAICP